MSAVKIFWKDPYLTELVARVTSVNSDTLTLDRTIFYVVSGGQESDTGTAPDWDHRLPPLFELA